MLVLTRKANQSIRIGNNIIIKILDASNGHTKIGIEAPVSIPVHRDEIYLKIQAENKASVLKKDIRPEMLEKLFADIK